jgi:signal transduction histidine kinase
MINDCKADGTMKILKYTGRRMPNLIFLRDNFQNLIDRQFHHESYNSVAMVKEFEKKFAGIYEIGELKSGIVQFLHRMMHFKSFALVWKISETTYRPIQLMGIDKCDVNKEFEVSFEIEELLKKTNIFSVAKMRQNFKIIEYCQGELIVPLIRADQLCGFIVLGPKLSGKSYSPQDIELLTFIANRCTSLFQTAVLYQKDIERQLFMEFERTRIAQEMHDEVGSSLTRISILAALVKNNGSDNGNTTRWLEQISDTSREVIQDMNQIIWALNTKNDTLEGLVAFIRRFALDFIEPCSLKCTFNFPVQLPGLALRSEVRRNIYLIIREALNNVVKHSNAAEVEISIKPVNGSLAIMIKDNGIGFDPESQQFPGIGLMNMKKRINDIGGHFVLESKPAKGTLIRLELPMTAGNIFISGSRQHLDGNKIYESKRKQES